MSARAARLSGSALAWGAAALLLAVLPQVMTSSVSHAILTQVLIAVVFALSYNVLLGQGGMLSFGHSVYYGLAAFAAMHAMAAIGDHGLWIPVQLLPLVGAAAGALSGAAFGYLASRRSGVTFAMITLGIAELVGASMLMFTFFSGGEQGVSADRTMGPELLGMTLAPRIEVYYVVAAWTLACAWLLYAFTRTPLGRMLAAVRDNAERTGFVGYDPQFVRFLGFTVAATFAGVAGGLAAINYEITTFDTISLQVSGKVLIMAYIGGITIYWGPVVGAVAITLMEVSLSDYTEAWPFYLGLLFVAVVLFAPRGLAGVLQDAWRFGRRAGVARAAAPLAACAGAGTVLLAGIIALVEMGYHLSAGMGESGRMTLFSVPVDAANPAYWAAALVLLGAGLAGLRAALVALGAADAVAGGRGHSGAEAS